VATAGRQDSQGSARGNLADLVREAAARVPDRPALTGGGAALSWAALDADVDAFAAGLQRLGVQAGARVVLALDNSAELVVAYFGSLRAGAVAVPLNTAYTPAEIGTVVRDAGARAVVARPPALAAARSALADVDTPPDRQPLLVVAGADASGAERAFAQVLADGRNAGRRVETSTGGEDLAVMIYTAGTTSVPKGAMLSHRALLANLDQCLALDPPPVTAEDVVLLVLPLFHIYALNGALGMVARTGATAVLADRFDPAGTLALVRDAGVTNVPGAPPMYVAWAEQDGAAEALAGVRTFLSGSAPLPAALFDRLRDLLGRPVHEGYGLTETAPVVSTTLGTPRVKPGSIGRPVPGVEIQILDEDAEEVEPGDPGEIHVRGPNLFSGYWPDGSRGPDEDGWYATGDLAYADEDGDLFLVGRLKELVLVSGFNVYPREVEDVLVAHPDVAEAAVVAVPDPVTGEAVKAFVVPVSGADAGPDDLRGGLAELCASRLARFKWPTEVEVVGSLPHSLSGKVAKRLLRGGGGGVTADG